MFYRPSENEVFVARREFFTIRELLSNEDSVSTIDLEEIQEVKDEESIVDTSMRYEAESEEPVVWNDISMPLPRSSRFSIPPELYVFI